MVTSRIYLQATESANEPHTSELLARTRISKHPGRKRHLNNMYRSSINEVSETNLRKVFATFSVGMVAAFIGAVVYSNVQLPSGAVEASTAVAVQQPATERNQSSAPETPIPDDTQMIKETSDTTDPSGRFSSPYRIRQVQPPAWTVPVRTPWLRSDSELRPGQGVTNSPETALAAPANAPSKPAAMLPTASSPPGVQQPYVPDQPRVTPTQQPQYFAVPTPPKPQISDSLISSAQSTAVSPQAAPLEAKPSQALPKVVTVQSGTEIHVRLAEALSSDRSRTGDSFRAALDSPLVVDGIVVAGTGSSVLGRIAQARKAPLLGGTSDLTLTLTDIATADGHLIRMNTDNVEQQGSRGGIVSTAKMATGAAVGAVIGAVSGAAEGAGISSSLRDDSRTSGFMATKRTVVLQSGTELNFKLVSPLRVAAS
jgi:hypothetical protein